MIASTNQSASTRQLINIVAAETRRETPRRTATRQKGSGRLLTKRDLSLQDCALCTTTLCSSPCNSLTGSATTQRTILIRQMHCNDSCKYTASRLDAT